MNEYYINNIFMLCLKKKVKKKNPGMVVQVFQKPNKEKKEDADKTLRMACFHV